MAKKRTLNKQDSEKLKEGLTEFNGIAKGLIRLLGIKVQEKERKINIMVSRIKRPENKDRRVDVTSMDISKGLIEKEKDRVRNRKQRGSEWDDGFTKKKGQII